MKGSKVKKVVKGVDEKEKDEDGKEKEEEKK